MNKRITHTEYDEKSNEVINAFLSPLLTSPMQIGTTTISGQYFETNGKAGEKPEGKHITQLLKLHKQWQTETIKDNKFKIWEKILRIHADQVYSIGLVAAVLQPVVVSNTLKNVPVSAIYNWNPGAHFGIYNPDTFWFDSKNKDQR